MPIGKKYCIRISEMLIEVPEEVYREHYKMQRAYRTLIEKDSRNGRLLYSELDTDELLGEELLSDKSQPSVEDRVISKIMCEKLCDCVKELSPDERALIKAIYFDGYSERQLSAIHRCSQKTINYKKHKILRKLEKMMEK